MKHLKSIIAILLAGAWISLSEFLRNSILVHDQWLEHYQGLGIEFPGSAINNAVWGVWSMMLAVSLFFVSRKFGLWQTTLLAWFMTFVMMWVAIGNLSALPYMTLIYAIPLSFLEVFVAAIIVKRVGDGKRPV